MNTHELFDGPGERRGLELWVEVTVEIGRADFERLAEGVFAFAHAVHEQVLEIVANDSAQSTLRTASRALHGRR